MGYKTKISWTDRTWNSWIGCSRVSEGCRFCYAATFVKNRMGKDLWGPSRPRQRTKTTWKNVLHWDADAAMLKEVGVLGEGYPLLVFVGSLMDWAEDRPDLVPIREEMWDVIRLCRNLNFQLLTKRPHKIKEFLPPDWGDGYPNVWLGTSIENMDVAWRADKLREIPARVRFVSYEPALGPLDALNLSGIDWLIYGGESGPGHRQEDKEWARRIMWECHENGVAFFHKQSSGARTETGVELDGKIFREFPYRCLKKLGDEWEAG